jgi:hypothetical protein
VSVLDDFRAAEKRVIQRLKELEPAVAEYRQLETVAERLAIEVPAATPTTRGTRSRGRRSRAAPATRNGATPTSRGNRRTQPGKRDEQLLALIRERPGITVREAGQALSIDATGLYRVVARLEQRGDVRKNGRELQPVTPS